MAPAAVEAPTRKKITSQTVTEFIPGNSTEGDASVLERYKGDFWQVIGSIKQDEWMAFGGGHQVRVYRADDRWQNSSSPVGNKMIEPFTEDTIREKWGGGRYNLWLYAPPDGVKLVGSPMHLELEGIPKLAAAAPEPNATGAFGNTTDMLIRELLTELRLSRGGTLAADSMKQAMDLNARALSSGVEAVRATLAVPTAPAAPDPMAGLMQEFMRAMITKAMNPPETNSLKETLELISTLKGSGLIGGVKPDLMSTLASSLPTIADRVVAGLHEFRMTSEANERTLRLTRGEFKPGDPNVIDVKPAEPQPQPPPTPAPAQGVTPDVAAQIIVQEKLLRLVAGIKQPDSTGEDMYDYLRNVWPEILDELAQFNKGQLLMFFRSPEMQQQKLGNTILAEVGNDPRLPKLIEQFLVYAKDNEAPPTPAV